MRLINLRKKAEVQPVHSSYDCFTAEQSRIDIFLIGNELASYMHKNEIENVVLIDRSARPVYVALFRAWEDLYPGEKRPNVYFVNPEPFLLSKRGRVSELKSVHTRLMKETDKTLLLFDVCVHTGDTLRSVAEGFVSAGFKEVIKGVVSTHSAEYEGLRTIDFSFMSTRPNGGCYSFGHEDGVDKGSERALCYRYPRNLRDSARVRKEISRIFRDGPEELTKDLRRHTSNV